MTLKPIKRISLVLSDTYNPTNLQSYKPTNNKFFRFNDLNSGTVDVNNQTHAKTEFITI